MKIAQIINFAKAWIKISDKLIITKNGKPIAIKRIHWNTADKSLEISI